MRFGDKLKIDFEKDVENPGFEIAPLLLIPFIENATKHGIGHGENNRIEVSLKQKNQDLTFEVYNLKPDIFSDEKPTENITTGLGLNQVKSRLKIVYPDSHKLEIKEDEKSFRISLKIHGKQQK